jgi:hypothetical protein
VTLRDAKRLKSSSTRSIYHRAIRGRKRSSKKHATSHQPHVLDAGSHLHGPSKKMRALSPVRGNAFSKFSMGRGLRNAVPWSNCGENVPIAVPLSICGENVPAVRVPRDDRARDRNPQLAKLADVSCSSCDDQVDQLKFLGRAHDDRMNRECFDDVMLNFCERVFKEGDLLN